MFWTLAGALCFGAVVYSYINKEDSFGRKTNKLGQLLMEVIFPRMSWVTAPFKVQKPQTGLRKRKESQESREDSIILADSDSLFVNAPKRKPEKEWTLFRIGYTFTKILLMVLILCFSLAGLIAIIGKINYIYLQQTEDYNYFKTRYTDCLMKSLEVSVHPGCSEAKAQLSMWPSFRTALEIVKGIANLFLQLGPIQFIIVCGGIGLYLYSQYWLLRYRFVSLIGAMKKIKKTQ